MAVALDAVGTAQDTNQAVVTSFSYTGITVGSGSNRALVFLALFEGSNPGTITAIWDSAGAHQVMTPLVSISDGANDFIYVFGLRNPTSGNKTLSVSWPTSTSLSCAAISFTGVNQGSDAAAFPSTNTATATSASTSNTIASSVGDYCVEAMGCQSTATSNGTQFVFDNNTPTDNLFAQYIAGTAISTTLTNALGGSTIWISAAVDVGQILPPPPLRPKSMVMM